MKQFFEQYGKVALGILALIVLIAMITPVGNIIKTSLQGTSHSFSSHINEQTDTMSEQMSNAFDVASGYAGIKNNAFYFDGHVWEPTKNLVPMTYDGINYICVDSTTGMYYAPGIDLNLVLDGTMYTGGKENIKFQYCIDDVCEAEQYKDTFKPIPLDANHKLEFKVATKPDNIEIEPLVVHSYDVFANCEFRDFGGSFDLAYDYNIKATTR